MHLDSKKTKKNLFKYICIEDSAIQHYFYINKKNTTNSKQKKILFYYHLEALPERSVCVTSRCGRDNTHSRTFWKCFTLIYGSISIRKFCATGRKLSLNRFSGTSIERARSTLVGQGHYAPNTMLCRQLLGCHKN